MSSKAISLDTGEEESIDIDIDEPVFQSVSDNEWAHNGNIFRPRTRADKINKLPGGVYEFRSNPVEWWLEQTTPRFEFPFKVYHSSDKIIERIKINWRNNTGNLGILMNGLRGAGKTMTAQLLSNDLIEEDDIPVLVVRSPIPLQIVLSAVQQEMVIIFDEFEKSHKDKEQQQLLSVIDGMSRNSHDRLYIFTTNRTEINENFRDRPSRIHYKFEFSRVDDQIIEGLINDTLPQDLKHFRADIFEYLNSRDICTIDIVKAVIQEVATFRESPLEFEEMLNIAKSDPPSYAITLLDQETNEPLQAITQYFKLMDRHDTPYVTSLFADSKASLEKFSKFDQSYSIYSGGWDGNTRLVLLEKCYDEQGNPEPGCWLAKINLPRSLTPYKDFDFLGDCNLWLDERPKNFKTFPRSSARDPETKKELEEQWNAATCMNTVHGTGNIGIFKIKIVANEKIKMKPWRKKGD